MTPALLVGGGMVAALAGLGLLRRGWGAPRRSARINAGGWGLLALGHASGGAGAGAWGLAVVAVGTTIAAFLLLAAAACEAPRPAARASRRHAGVLTQPDGPRAIGRRVGTFLLAGPLAFAVALLVALALRALAGLGGWHEANGNALALFALPVAWTILMTLLAIDPRPRARGLTLALPSLVAGLVLLAGAA